MGLREILDAATPGPWKATIEAYSDEPGELYVSGIQLGENDFIETDGGFYGPRPENARLIALAPELAALVLDMGEELRMRVCPCTESDYQEPDCPICPLLARLDQIGKEQT